jgi:DNA-binding PadR family transcriptional regulator
MSWGQVAAVEEQTRDWWRIQDALIGFLAGGPLDAAALTQAVEHRLPGADLPLRLVHVMLHRLTRSGFVTSLPPGALPGGPPLRMIVRYRVTERGLEHLRDWLRSPLPVPQIHDELLTRLVVCSRSDAPRLIELVKERIGWCSKQALSLQFISDEIVEMRSDGLPVDDWRTTTRVLARDCELAYWTAQMGFLEDVREMLEALRDGRRGR